ncbi:hypothetical protein GGF50DRAFT_58414 [Schizophyllum commune]
MSPSKTSGQYHEKKGNLKKTIGRLLRLRGTEDRGRIEHAQGTGEYNAARAQGYAEGTGDRITGKKDSVVGATRGATTDLLSGEARENKGNWRQRFNRKI